MSLVRRPIRLIRGLSRAVLATMATLALVLVVPYLLVRFVGNPVPTSLPPWDEVLLSVRSRQVDDSLVVQLLAIVVWVVWAQLLASLFVEVRATARGVRTSAIRGLGATQWLARRLVAQFTLASTLFVQGSVGLALPATPALADVVPEAVIIDTDDDAGPVADLATHGLLVEVERTDTLWDLAEEHLDEGSRWTEIRDANVGRRMVDGSVLGHDFVTINGNWSLLVPSDGASVAEASGAAAETVIGAWRVEPGDHFWKMAETVLGEGWGRPPTETEIRGYWLDIIGHNRGNLISPGNDPNLIYADQSFEILLPPLPDDELSAGDSLATTTPQPLTAIPQFEPVRHPPPSHRSQPDEGPTATPDNERHESSDRDGPVVEITGADAVATDDQPAEADAAVLGSPSVDGDRRALGQDNGIAVPLSGRTAQTLAVAGIGLSGVVAALFLSSLRSRRHYQASRRRPGSIPELPDEDHRQFENRVRAIADHEALRWLTAANKFLTHTLDGGESWTLPAIVAMRAGDHGLEVLLDEEAGTPRGFLDGRQPRSWLLDPDIEVRQLEGEAADRVPYAPLLLPVGGTGGGDLLLDLAQFGVVGLAGPDEAVTGWLRSLTVAVASSSWSDDVRVVAVGVDPILDRMPHVEVPDDPVHWASEEVRRRQAEGPRPDSRYEQRLQGNRVAETLVLVGPGHEGVAQHLVEVAELVNTPFTLVAAAPLRGDARIQFEGNRATLEPTGVTFWPSVMEAEAIAMTTSLLDQSADTGSVPVDVHYADEVPGVRVGAGPGIAGRQERTFGATAWTGQAVEGEGDDRHELSDEPANPPSALGPPTPPPNLRESAAAFGAAADSNSEASLFASLEDRADAVDPIGDEDNQGDTGDPLGLPEVEPDEEGIPGAPPGPVGDRELGQRPTTVQTTESRAVLDGGEMSAEPGRLFAEPDAQPEPRHGTDDVRASLGESEPVAAEIGAVLGRKPIEVAVLTANPVVNGTVDRLTPKNAAVVAYLAFHRSATSIAVREAFWPSSVNRSTSDNAISLIRRNLGRAADDTPRLHLASEGRFTVSDEVGCDWTRFEVLVARSEAAKRDGAIADEMALLRAALSLIDGPIASDVDLKNWSWLRDDPTVYSRVETAIVDVAHRLGYLGCEHDMPELARWAADKGLTVVPEQEALYRIQMSAASLAGDESTVQNVFRQAQRSAQPHGDGVQPETELLYRRLVGFDEQSRGRQEGIG